MFLQETARKRKNLKKRKATFLDDSGDEDLNNKISGKKFFKYHSTCGHTTDECTMLKVLIRQTEEKIDIHFKNKKKYTKHKVNVMVKKRLRKY